MSNGIDEQIEELYHRIMDETESYDFEIGIKTISMIMNNYTEAMLEMIEESKEELKQRETI
ncbi:MAG: hypothetical protein LBJ20_00855 [Candidatus Methanoplasma sp.]|jgi:hypothetical protein|nr:hypothetical protein [Candidatus Methanoplasma sp.]